MDTSYIAFDFYCARCGALVRVSKRALENPLASAAECFEDDCRFRTPVSLLRMLCFGAKDLGGAPSFYGDTVSADNQEP